MDAEPLFSYVAHPRHPLCELLVVDGEVDRESLVNNHGERRSVYLTNGKTIPRLLSMRLADLEARFGSLSFPLASIASPHEFIRLVMFDWISRNDSPRIEFIVPLNIRTWQRPWSITDFMDELKAAALEAESGMHVYDPTSSSEGTVGADCRVGIQINDMSRPANDVLLDEMSRVVQLLDRTVDRLDMRMLEQTLLTTYRFPSHLSAAACEYLRYFVQFLHDLGVDAHSELKERAGVVIFKVVPTSRSDALQRIAEALCIYLNFPFMPEFAEVSEPYQDVAVVELRRVVQDMQSALLRARADIDVLQITHQYPQLSLPADVTASFPSGGNDPSPAAKVEPEQESLFGGVVHLDKFKFNGGNIELGKILRSLKRTAKRLLGIIK